MASFVETATRTFESGATISQHLRVKITSGTLAVAGAGVSDDDVEIGTVERDCVSGDQVSVRLRNAQGSTKMIAGEALAAGATVYGAASGKVADTASGNPIGVALTAAGADGDIIEVLRF